MIYIISNGTETDIKAVRDQVVKQLKKHKVEFTVEEAGYAQPRSKAKNLQK